MERKQAITYIAEWLNKNVAAVERGKFREIAESDFLSLLEENFARLAVRPSEFAAWQVAWESKELKFLAPEERYGNNRR